MIALWIYLSFIFLAGTVGAQLLCIVRALTARAQNRVVLGNTSACIVDACGSLNAKAATVSHLFMTHKATASARWSALWLGST